MNSAVFGLLIKKMLFRGSGKTTRVHYFEGLLFRKSTVPTNAEPNPKPDPNTNLKGDVRRTTKSADFICRQNRPTKICRVSCKNRLILSDKIEHVLSSTILLADFLYIEQQILFVLPW